MGLFRDKGDDRSVREVVDDVLHDLAHRAARFDRGGDMRDESWPHDGECAYTRHRDGDR